jgi:hypothetical protein
MRLRAAITGIGFVAAAALAVPVLAHQAVQQGVQKPLYPPNLIVTGDSILVGLSIEPVKAVPLSGTIETENNSTDKDGREIVQRFRAKIWRDSHGRTRVDTDMNPVGEKIDERLRQTAIYDAVAKTQVQLFPASKVAIRTSDEPARPAKPASGRVMAPILIEPRELSEPLSSGKPQPTIDIHREEVAGEELDGMAVRHGRQTINYPVGSVGNKEAYRTVTDYWYSEELQIFVRVSEVGLGNSTHSLRLVDIGRAEPPRSVFGVPKGYAVSQTHPVEWESQGYCPLP